MTWNYPYTIVNGDAPDASRLQSLLDYARRNVNAVTDDEVTGISEGGVPPRIVFDEEAGHDHDGTNDAAIALASYGLFTKQGSVKVATKTVDVAAISFSADLVTGTGLTRVIGIWVGMQGAGELEYNGAFRLNSDVNDGSWYVVVNPAGATDEAYIFNGIGSSGGYTGGGVDWQFYVVMVGV